VRSNLPPELRQRFEPVRNLNVAGGQADLVLCRRRQDGQDVVVKLYRFPQQLDRAVLETLHQASPAHVVRLLEHGETGGIPWEVQEYCPHGTLEDLRLNLGGRLGQDQARLVVQEVAEALDHIHSLGITHRDIKPANILARRLEPDLDLVLTDFGVAREQVQGTQFTSVKATFAWAAPEVHEGALKSAVDWWALGGIVHLVLTGRHLLAGPDGDLAPDVQLRPLVMRGLYTTEAIADPRWRALADGLLSYRPEDRWGYQQVKEWLAGGDPPVVRTTPRGDQAAAGPERRDVVFVFNGHPVTTGEALAKAMRQDWQAAGDLLSGRLDHALSVWLRTRPDGETVVASLELERTGAARLVRLQALLDPAGGLEFQGRKLDDDALRQVFTAAAGWRPNQAGPAAEAVGWLRAVQQEGVLAAAAGVAGPEAAERLGRAHRCLEAWSRQWAEVRQQAPSGSMRDLVEEAAATTLAARFQAALGLRDGAELARQAKQVIAERETSRDQWAEDLATAALAAPDDDLGTLLATAQLVGAVTEITRDRIASEKAEREARAKADRAHWRRQARRRRASWLRGQLVARGLCSLVYALVVGSILDWAGRGAGASARLALDQSLDVFGLCLATLAFSLAVEWFLDIPAGLMRAAGAWCGAAIGAGPWVRWIVLDTQDVVARPAWAVLPVALSAGWVVGSLLQRSAVWATARRAPNRVSRRLARVRPWLAVPVVAAAATALGAQVLDHCGSACSAVARAFASNAGFIEAVGFDPLGVGASATALLVLAAASAALAAASVDWAWAAPPLGVAAAAVSPVLALVVVFAHLDSLVGWVLGGIASLL
jgi:hypothetical protein